MRPASDHKPEALVERGGSMNQRLRGLLVGGLVLAVLAVLAPAALAATVTVRIEGKDRTLLERTQVTVPSSGTFGPDNCPYAGAGGAIELGTVGNWDKSQ